MAIADLLQPCVHASWLRIVVLVITATSPQSGEKLLLGVIQITVKKIMPRKEDPCQKIVGFAPSEETERTSEISVNEYLLNLSFKCKL